MAVCTTAPRSTCFCRPHASRLRSRASSPQAEATPRRPCGCMCVAFVEGTLKRETRRKAISCWECWDLCARNMHSGASQIRTGRIQLVRLLSQILPTKCCCFSGPVSIRIEVCKALSHDSVAKLTWLQPREHSPLSRGYAPLGTFPD